MGKNWIVWPDIRSLTRFSYKVKKCVPQHYLFILPYLHLAPHSVQSGEGLSAADQLATMLGPDQMAALLGPSWKSRQPRMCQYCQRMFSNKFNLKQVCYSLADLGFFQGGGLDSVLLTVCL